MALCATAASPIPGSASMHGVEGSGFHLARGRPAERKDGRRRQHRRRRPAGRSVDPVVEDQRALVLEGVGALSQRARGVGQRYAGQHAGSGPRRPAYATGQHQETVSSSSSSRPVAAGSARWCGRSACTWWATLVEGARTARCRSTSSSPPPRCRRLAPATSSSAQDQLSRRSRGCAPAGRENRGDPGRGRAASPPRSRAPVHLPRRGTSVGELASPWLPGLGAHRRGAGEDDVSQPAQPSEQRVRSASLEIPADRPSRGEHLRHRRPSSPCWRAKPRRGNRPSGRRSRSRSLVGQTLVGPAAACARPIVPRRACVGTAVGDRAA